MQRTHLQEYLRYGQHRNVAPRGVEARAAAAGLRASFAPAVSVVERVDDVASLECHRRPSAGALNRVNLNCFAKCGKCSRRLIKIHGRSRHPEPPAQAFEE